MTDTASLISPTVPDRDSSISAEATGTPRHSEATRLLAAAAYQDRRFRTKVLHEIEEQPFRAFSPEFGIDRRTVLAHCAKARRREDWRDAALVLCWLPLVLGGFFADLANYPEEFPDVVAYHADTLVLAYGLAFAIVLADILLTEHLTLGRRLSRAGYGKADRVEAKEAQNVVVYGAFSPFVGSGLDLGGWSFTVNLERGKSGFETDREAPQPFALDDLYRAIEQAIARLGLDGLLIEDRLFVDGRYVRDDRRFLPRMFGRPVTVVGRDLIQQYRGKSSQAVRHYLCIEITDWDGEMVVSTFLRLQKSASKLFVEASYFFVPPLKAKYYRLDARENRVTLDMLRAWLVRAALGAIVLPLLAPFRTAGFLLRPLNRLVARRALRKAVRANPRYNYGATVSIRELGTENNYRVYFQKLDKEMHVKIVQQQILDTLIEFLDAHGVDTSEIRDRGSTIMNNGVIVSGGAVTAEALAVGSGAKAQSPKRAAQGALRRVQRPARPAA